MCLIFISFDQHPRYKLLVAGNRDEFYSRPTQPAAYWKDFPAIVGGRDLEAGGTWLGVTTNGKISMLTNYRDPLNIDPVAPTRGRLVADYLEGDQPPAPYLESINASGTRYNGFNLLAGNADELYYYSNYQRHVQRLRAGFYGLSNKFLDTPWPKLVRGKEKIGPAFARPDPEPEEIFELLYDDTTAPPEDVPHTGLPWDKELALSAMFIKTSNYGSRCSTIVAIDRDNNCSFWERTYDIRDFSFTDRAYRFTVVS